MLQQRYEGIMQLKINTTIDLGESCDGGVPDQTPQVRDEPADLNSSNSSDLAPSDHESSSDDNSDSSGFAQTPLVTNAIFMQSPIGHYTSSADGSSNPASSLSSSENDSQSYLYD